MLATDTTCRPYAPDTAADRVTTRLVQLTLCNEQRRVADLLAPAHPTRRRARGGMIAARYFQTVACGVTWLITALILSSD